MPMLNRRPHVLVPRRGASARNSTESNESVKEQLWIVDEDYEKPQKEMDFPSVKRGHMPSRPKSGNALRIDTSTQQDLHDRYLSSEEEPSPSPDDDGQNGEEELKQMGADIFVDDLLDDSLEDFKAEIEIATAVPILAFCRPKLIDITNLAPMHKRKRTAKPLLPQPAAKKNGAVGASATAAAPVTTVPAIATTASAASASPPVEDENQSSPAHDVTVEPATSAHNTRHQLKRKESFAIPAPASWLPEDPHSEAEDERDQFPSLKTRSNPGYGQGYEPLTLGLDATRRIPNRSLHHFSTRVLETNSHNPSGPSLHPALTATGMSGTGTGWKGLTRSLSLVKRNSGSPPVSVAVGTKRPKMIPRGANEREQSPIIPPFPSDGEVTVAS